MNTILLIGRPGSGKGTQAKVLAQKLGWTHLSSGDRIKEIRDSGEPYAARVRELYDAGALLPDWFADYLLESSLLTRLNTEGIVAEGFGRTATQAAHVLEVMEWMGRAVTVVHLEVSEEEVTRRMLERAKTEDRPDSNAVEKIQARLQKFTDDTGPALAFFREKGLVVDVDGERSPEGVTEEIVTKLGL